MRIYIASSWKNQHAVELLTDRLRNKGHEVLSFVENNHGENANSPGASGAVKAMPFDEWCMSELGQMSFDYDTNGAMYSDLVIYVGPSGCDAWAEVGAAWANGVTVFALQSKGEQVGLMRRMGVWFTDYRELLAAVDLHCESGVQTAVQ